MSVPLSTARTEVARRAQEFLAGTATGGSTTTILDTNDLWHTDGYWDETWVRAASGTNSGVVRRVSSFLSASSSLTLYSAFANAVASGMQFELYRKFPPTDVDLAINRSINVGAPDFREKVRAILSTTLNTLTYAVPSLPDALGRDLIGVEYQYYTDPSQSDWPFQKLSTDLWEVIEAWDSTNNVSKKTIQLKFNPDSNRQLRLVYDGILGNVTADSDRIHLDLPELEWLYQQSTAELWRMEVSRTADASRKSALEELARHETRADVLRRQLRKEPAPRPLRRTTFRVIPN